MTPEFWNHQKSRLIDRFGERNFSREFSLLVAVECNSMPDQEFLHAVSAMIGARKPSDPPLIKDFRDARLAYERRVFERDVRGASNAMNQTPWSLGLRAYLAKEFPGCKTINEAVEVRKMQIQIRQAEESNYDPMRDVKWMGET